jgi:drug/metabolite transporter (DMT)-like permease
VQSLDSFSIVFRRLVIGCAALATALVVFSQPFQFKLVKKNLKELLSLSFFFFLSLHFVLFTFSVRDTTILNATVLVSTTPILSIFVSSLIFKVKPSRFATASLMISFLGVCLIAFGEATATKTVGQGVSPTLKGDLEAVGAAVVEAFYLNFGVRVRRS